MPKVTAQGKNFECDRDRNLRKVLLENDVELYNGKSKIINCMGIGSCGTCAVVVEGLTSEKNWKERARLGLPPHSSSSDRRLACQIKVNEDIRVTKYDGFWGQGSEVVWTAESDI